MEIYSDTYAVEKENNYLEILKLTVKKAVIKDWGKIIWLIDRDSECLSVELYPQIYKTENLMRELINEVMAKQYGTSWWDSFVPSGIREKHAKRLRDYKAKVPAFNNVDEKLMSIDIDDLGELITLKRYKWVPAFDESISLLLNGVEKYDENKIRELLMKQRVVEIDLWQEQFSRYLPENFKERFVTFAKDRNHIMHNKLIDRTVYAQIKDLAERIETDLIQAIEKSSEMNLSAEDKEEIEKQRQMELEMQAVLEHERKEQDAHVSIRSYYAIKELFENSLSELLTDIDATFHFRCDIEIKGTLQKSRAEDGELISIKSIIDDTQLTLTYDMSINDEEGADSTLSIYDSESERVVTSIIYRNASVEFDPDSGLYMPTLEDEISSVAAATDDVVKFINDTIINYKETVAPEDTAEFVCCAECEDDAICINEDILSIGTCMNCGNVNEVLTCDICGQWFNHDIDGSYDGDIAICQNCLDKMEAE